MGKDVLLEPRATWIGECVPGGQEKALGKADLVTLFLEEFFDEFRDICRDSQAYIKAAASVSWVEFAVM